jgi:hypothetical protein
VPEVVCWLTGCPRAGTTCTTHPFQNLPVAPAWHHKIASVANSPLVSQTVASPLVARSLLADPRERDALLRLPYSRSKKGGGSGGSSSSKPFGLLSELRLGWPPPHTSRLVCDAAASSLSLSGLPHVALQDQPSRQQSA